MANPTLADYISLDTLLEGYSKEPLVSSRYEVTCSEDRSGVTDEILSKLSLRFGFDEKTSCHVEQIIGEGVQNIAQHCCGQSDVRIYASQAGDGFIGAFELSDEAQFGKVGHQLYQEVLSLTRQKSSSPGYDKELSDYANCEGIEEELEGFYFGTLLIMRTPGIKQMGIADIGGRAYFFFEYRLG
jgi:hypothetical protein